MDEKQLESYIGCTIKKDIFNGRGVVIIPQGTVVDDHHIDLLLKHEAVFDLELFERPDVVNNESLVTNATRQVEALFELIRRERTIPLKNMTASLIPTIQQAAEYPSLFSVLSGLQAKDDYTYRHNIGVGVISTLIGKWLHLGQDDLELLSTAATLHDVGKIHISDDILNKPGRYTDSEYAVMKQHTVLGYDIIRQTPDASPRMALVALQHHERENGGGYPHGITGDRMDYFSKIVAVADIFHAMTTKRVYKDAMPFYLVIRQMQEDSFGVLDPTICKLFVRRIMELAVGDEVMLTDGRRARVLNVNPLDILNPLVTIGKDYVDLSRASNLHIQALVS